MTRSSAMPMSRVEFVSRVRGLPDVDDAAVTFFHGLTARDGIRNGRSASLHWRRTDTRSCLRLIARTMHLQILKGRNFLDGYSSEAEVIIDQKSANALWPGLDPIGRQIKLGKASSTRAMGASRRTRRQTWRIRRSSSRRGRAGSETAPLGAVYYLPTASDSMIIAIPKGASSAWTRGFVFQIVTRSKSDHERMPITLQALPAGHGPVRASFSRIE